eukprot:scaffold32898_cov253-Isochrysis_galbana.AAC.1
MSAPKVVLLDILQQDDLGQAICAMCQLAAVGRLRRTCRAARWMRMHPEFEWARQHRRPPRSAGGRAVVELLARAARKPQAARWLAVAEPQPLVEAMLSATLPVLLRVHALARLHELARPRSPGMPLHMWGDPLAFAAQPEIRECAAAIGLPEPVDMAVLVVVLLGSGLASGCLISKHPVTVLEAAGRMWHAPHPVAQLSVLVALTILRSRGWGLPSGPPAVVELVECALRQASLWNGPCGARAIAGRAVEAFAPDLSWGDRLSKRVLMAAAFGARRGDPDVSPFLRALQHAQQPGARRLLRTRGAMMALGRLATAAGGPSGYPVQNTAARLLVRLARSAKGRKRACLA